MDQDILKAPDETMKPESTPSQSGAEVGSTFSETGDPETSSRTHSSSDSSDDDDNFDKKKRRRAKNREYARVSRKKKRDYLDYLEKTVEKLEDEASSLRAMIAVTSTYPPDFQFQVTRKNLYQALEDAVNDASISDESINQLLDELKVKIGVAAQDRMQTLDRMFHQTLNLVIPLHIKYFLWTSHEEKDFFRSPEFSMHNISQSDSLLFSEYIQKARITPEQFAAVGEYKNIILQEKDEMSECLQHIKEMKESIIRYSNEFEKIMERCKGFLTPRQNARILIWLEKHQPMPSAEDVLTMTQRLANLALS